MPGAFSTHGETVYAYKIMMGKPTEKITRRRSRDRWKKYQNKYKPSKMGGCGLTTYGLRQGQLAVDRIHTQTHVCVCVCLEMGTGKCL
jgi:hypothetical protein